MLQTVALYTHTKQSEGGILLFPMAIQLTYCLFHTIGNPFDRPSHALGLQVLEQVSSRSEERDMEDLFRLVARRRQEHLNFKRAKEERDTLNE